MTNATEMNDVYDYSLILVKLRCACQIQSGPPLQAVYLKLIFDYTACSQLLMLMMCCISGDSKGDG